jgi:hypothetical protein
MYSYNRKIAKAEVKPSELTSVVDKVTSLRFEVEDLQSRLEGAGAEACEEIANKLKSLDASLKKLVKARNELK